MIKSSGLIQLEKFEVTKVYFTVKELQQLTGFSQYKIVKIIKLQEVPYNQHSCRRTIRIHRNEVNKYFHIKL